MKYIAKKFGSLLLTLLLVSFFIVLCLFRHTRRCGKIAAWHGGDAGAD